MITRAERKKMLLKQAREVWPYFSMSKEMEESWEVYLHYCPKSFKTYEPEIEILLTPMKSMFEEYTTTKKQLAIVRTSLGDYHAAAKFSIAMSNEERANANLMRVVESLNGLYEALDDRQKQTHPQNVVKINASRCGLDELIKKLTS